MKDQRFPPGWDEQRVQRLLAELDNRTEEEWVATDRAAAADGTTGRGHGAAGIASRGSSLAGDVQARVNAPTSRHT